MLKMDFYSRSRNFVSNRFPNSFFMTLNELVGGRGVSVRVYNIIGFLVELVS